MSTKQFKECYHKLSNTPLTAHITEQEFITICAAHDVYVKHCQPGDKIFTSESYKDAVVVVIDGRIQAIQEDFSGTRFIIKSVEQGEALSITVPKVENNNLSYSVEAEAKDTVILLLNVRSLTNPWPTQAPESTFLQNLLHFMLSAHHLTFQHLVDLSKRTTREKLLSYLINTAIEQQSNAFSISMSRKELADYLCVDRSAMSTELTKLQKAGFLDYEGNRFSLSSDLMKYL